MKNFFNKYDIETIIKLMLIELKKLKTSKNNQIENDDEIVIQNLDEEKNIEDNAL